MVFRIRKFVEKRMLPSKKQEPRIGYDIRTGKTSKKR